MYDQVFQVVFVPEVPPPKPCMCISFFLIGLPEQYLIRCERSISSLSFVCAVPTSAPVTIKHYNLTLLKIIKS